MKKNHGEVDVVNAYWEEYLNGDETHINEIREYCYARVMYKTSNILFVRKADLEDFQSDIFILMLNGRDKYDKEKGCFTTWYEQIVNSYFKHLWEKEYNKTKYFKLDSIDRMNDDPDCANFESYMPDEYLQRGGEDTFFENYEASFVLEKLEKASSNYARVFKLCVLDGFTPREVAKIMNCKPSDISRYLNRAKMKAREIYMEAFEL